MTSQWEFKEILLQPMVWIPLVFFILLLVIKTLTSGRRRYRGSYKTRRTDYGQYGAARRITRKESQSNQARKQKAKD